MLLWSDGGGDNLQLERQLVTGESRGRIGLCTSSSFFAYAPEDISQGSRVASCSMIHRGNIVVEYTSVPRKPNDHFGCSPQPLPGVINVFPPQGAFHGQACGVSSCSLSECGGFHCDQRHMPWTFRGYLALPAFHFASSATGTTTGAILDAGGTGCSRSASIPG